MAQEADIDPRLKRRIGYSSSNANIVVVVAFCPSESSLERILHQVGERSGGTPVAFRALPRIGIGIVTAHPGFVQELVLDDAITVASAPDASTLFESSGTDELRIVDEATQ